MIAVLVCNPNRTECSLLNRDCREQIAACSEEDIHLDNIPDDAGLIRVTQTEQLVNLLYYSFRKGQNVQVLRDFRRTCDGAMMMLITDSSVSPLEYLRPGIAPDSLILRPLEVAQFSEVNREFISSFLERFRHTQTQRFFVVDTREEKILIPWFHICYFEARDKKIFVRTRDEEYAFYDTIDALESRLPGTFRRCHRSYIVNTEKILRMIPSGHCLELSDGTGVPVSRTYRARFREVLHKPEELS